MVREQPDQSLFVYMERGQNFFRRRFGKKKAGKSQQQQQELITAD